MLGLPMNIGAISHNLINLREPLPACVSQVVFAVGEGLVDFFGQGGLDQAGKVGVWVNGVPTPFLWEEC